MDGEEFIVKDTGLGHRYKEESVSKTQRKNWSDVVKEKISRKGKEWGTGMGNKRY